MPPCLIGMEACVGAHHLSRKLRTLGHDARLMPAKYVRPYSKGQKNDFRDAEAIAEAVQRPTMKFVATKTAEQLDLQALHRVRERLVSQRTGIINQIRAPSSWSAGAFGPDARDLLKPPAFFTRTVPGMDTFLDDADLCRGRCVLAGKNIEAETALRRECNR